MRGYITDFASGHLGRGLPRRRLPRGPRHGVRAAADPVPAKRKEKKKRRSGRRAGASTHATAAPRIFIRGKGRPF